MRDLKIGESAVSGRVFNVKRKMIGDKKLQEFALGISKKNKDGSYTNGFLNVSLWGDTKVEDKQDVGLIGRLEPEVYTNKEGVEVKQIRFNANEVFKPATWDKKESAKEEEDESNPWKD